MKKKKCVTNLKINGTRARARARARTHAYVEFVVRILLDI